MIAEVFALFAGALSRGVVGSQGGGWCWVDDGRVEDLEEYVEKCSSDGVLVFECDRGERS